MIWNIEFYREDDFYCAFISSENGTGIEIRKETQAELATEIALYVQYLTDDLENWNE